MQHLRRGDAGWPLAFEHLRPPPEQLFLRGAWPHRLPAVAIVGTRRASVEACDLTFRVAADLARSGVVIVSGGAYGIDAAAHEGALDVGGVTVAILGTPLEPAYPRDHAALYERIAERGAVATELEHGASVRAGRFLHRNRLIAAVADAVVVVQAPVQSGALSTARAARQLGRPVLAMPWSPLEAASEGTNALLFDGLARLVRDGRDVAACLGLTLVPRAAPAASVAHEGLTARVLSALTREPRHADELARELDVPAPQLLHALLELTLAGDAEPEANGYRRTRRR